MDVGVVVLSVPIGAQELTISGLMIIILVFRPDGIMGGREVPWPFGKAGRIARDGRRGRRGRRRPPAAGRRAPG